MMGEVLRQGQRTGRGGQRINGFNVVFEQDGDAVQRATRPTFLPFGVQRFGDGQGFWVNGQNAVEVGAVLINLLDAIQVNLDDFLGSHAAIGHHFL